MCLDKTMSGAGGTATFLVVGFVSDGIRDVKKDEPRLLCRFNVRRIRGRTDTMPRFVVGAGPEVRRPLSRSPLATALPRPSTRARGEDASTNGTSAVTLGMI